MFAEPAVNVKEIDAVLATLATGQGALCACITVRQTGELRTPGKEGSQTRFGFCSTVRVRCAAVVPRPFPSFVVMSPGDEHDVAGMLCIALAHDE
jgi:hypothetical protein